MFIGIGSGIGFITRKRNYLIDNFNRADNLTSPGKTNTGQTWFTTGGGVWGVTNRRLKMISGAGNGRCLVNFNMSDVKITTVLTGDLSNQRILFRYVDDNNEWFLNGNTVAKRVNGTVTAAGLLSVTPKNGDVVSIVLKGASISVYVNESRQISVTDSTFMNATIFGLFSATSTTEGFFSFYSLEMV